MGDRTGISWTQTHNPDGTVTPGATWNPVSGCTKLTAECKHCYVERDWHRLTHLPAYQGRKFADVACHEDRLDQPIRWQRGRRIFVCSTSDLFHVDVPDDFLDHVFGVMALCPQHTFLVLTKRADRLHAYLSAFHRAAYVEGRAKRIARERGQPIPEGKTLKWPLSNVHVGVTTGTQESANVRIPLLLDTPAAKRWVSMEPLLEPVRLTGLPGLPLDDEDVRINALAGEWATSPRQEKGGSMARLDWCVVGGESGRRKSARPMHPQWARDLRDQCLQYSVPFYFKQQGEWIPGQCATNDQLNNPKVWGCWVNVQDGKTHEGNDAEAFRDGDMNMLYVGRKAAGEKLDGREYKEMIAHG